MTPNLFKTFGIDIPDPKPQRDELEDFLKSLQEIEEFKFIHSNHELFSKVRDSYVNKM